MIAVKDILVSDSTLSTRFACDLKKCKGACCIEGLAGPPVTQEEVKVITSIFPKIKHRLRPEGIKVIETKGISEKWQGEEVLTCVNDRECVFVVYRNGIAYCGIEEAYNQGEIAFQKPMSCHLFPVRVRDFFGQIAVNTVESPECAPAFKRGNSENIPLIDFLESALQRRFGSEWVAELKQKVAAIQV